MFSFVAAKLSCFELYLTENKFFFSLNYAVFRFVFLRMFFNFLLLNHSVFTVIVPKTFLFVYGFIRYKMHKVAELV